MTDMSPLSPRDEDDLTAAEYVLGVQDHATRQATRTRLRGDADFAAAVQDWENRLGDLNEGYADVQAPDLMPLIEARIFGRVAPKAAFWRNWIAGAVGAAVLTGVIVAILPQTGSRVPVSVSGSGDVIVARLTGDTDDLRFDVARKGDRVTVTRVSGPAPAETKSHQLWLIAGDNAPVPLGLLDAGSETVSVPTLAKGMVLAVSLEPRGGSTTGAPTGPVLVSGKVMEDL